MFPTPTQLFLYETNGMLSLFRLDPGVFNPSLSLFLVIFFTGREPLEKKKKNYNVQAIVCIYTYRYTYIHNYCFLTAIIDVAKWELEKWSIYLPLYCPPPFLHLKLTQIALFNYLRLKTCWHPMTIACVGSNVYCCCFSFLCFGCLL